ncbi:hypothetical protein FQN60_012313, partial [Etheostoma spectabile]
MVKKTLQTTRGPQSHSGTPSSGFVFTLNPPTPVKLSHPASSTASSSRPYWPPQAHLDSQSAFSLHEGRGEASGALDVDPQPLHLNSPEDLGQRPCHDVSTLTDLCSDLPELEIVSLLSEGQPNYTLRADSVFGYDNDDWLHTPLLPPTVALGLTHEQIEETLKYFSAEGCFSPVTMEVWSSSASEEEEEKSTFSLVDEVVEKEKKFLGSKNNNNNNNNNNSNKESLCREVTQVLCSDRVGQVTKTYHDIKAVTHLLEEKERDLELAARIGQSLLKQNLELTARNEMLDEQLEIAKEEIAQLRHELSMRDDLLQFYASTEEIENAELRSPIKRNESCSSLSNLVHHDFLQHKLKGLEDENRKLRLEASDLTTETANYEEQEQELMMVCVEELSSVNKQVVDLSEELARKVEDFFRQQEEISSLLAQIVDLQARCKGLKDLQDKYSQCEDMLCEAREDIKNLRNKSLPNSTVQRYTALASVLPMDSLAAEIEGTFRKGLDTPAPTEYKNHPWRVFETVKVVNKAVKLRSRCHSPGLPGSSPVSIRSSCTSTPRTSYYGSDNASLTLEDKSSSNSALKEDKSGPKRLGQPGTPGGQDLEAALRSLSARQQNHSSERPFFDVERERKLHALAADCEEGVCSSGFLTPNDSLDSSPAASTSTNYSNGSSRPSCGSSGGSRSYLPDRLQIVKPLEGSVTLHQWQQLAKPNLGGILHPRPGVLTKDFRELEVDIQHVYSLNDLEEDELDLSQFSGTHGMVSPSGPNFSQTSPTHTITTCQVLQPSLPIPPFSTRFPFSHAAFSFPYTFCSLPPQWQKSSVKALSPTLKGAFVANLRSFGLPSCRNCELMSNSSSLHQHHFGLGGRTTTTTTTTPPDVVASSLGLLQLLHERGISAFPCPMHTSHSTKPSPSTAKDKCGGSLSDNEGRRNIFSLNLVEKLQSLGLHRVAARGTTGRNWERET